MSTLPNPPLLPERPDTSAAPETSAPHETTAPAPAVMVMSTPAEPPVRETAATAVPAPHETAAPMPAPHETAAPVPASKPVPPPSAPPRPAVRPSRDDNVVLRNFSKAQPAALERLNADFGLKLDEGKFLRLRNLFANTLRRDPTAGELRLLDTLERANKGDPSREAVGELYTDSPLVAETWADMMAKHAALHAVKGTVRADKDRPAPPCTFDDALSLAGRYLHRVGVCLPVTDGGKNSQGSTAVLSEPWQEAEALAAGYVPVFRAAVGEGARSVWIRREEALPVTPEKAGDFLLCLRHASPQTVAALVEGERKKTRPAIGEIRAVARRSILDAVLSVCESAELYPHRLLRMDRNTLGGHIEADALCARSVLHADGTADYILRVPLKRMKEMSDTLRALSADTVMIGQVRGGDKTLIRMRNRMGTNDVAAAELPSAMLRLYPHVGLHRRRAEACPEKPSHGLGIRTPVLWRFPSPHAAEGGMISEDCEAVALTRTDGQVIPVPEADLLLSSYAVTVREEGLGYHAAMEAASYAVGSLTAMGIPAAHVRLTVSVTARDGAYAPGNLTVETLCGLYRFAASYSIPPEDPVLTWIPTAAEEMPNLSLTVTAWARDKSLCEKLTAETNAPRYAVDAPVSKEAPSFTLPVLHRSCEPSLRALSALLSSHGEAAVSILPIAMKTVEVEVEIPAESAAQAPRTRKESRHILDPDSVARLVERLGQWTTPVFATNTVDTHMLLSEPAVLAALERRLELGYPVIALSEACTVFAEKGLLPSALGEIDTIPAVGQEITSSCAPTGKTVIRMPRADLLTPSEEPDTPTLVTLTLPDGRALPDGFTGRDGKVLGLLNGLDTAALPLLFTHTFENQL